MLRLDLSQALEVLNRQCPFCKSRLRWRRVLERYPFRDFYSVPRNSPKVIRVSGCKEGHVFRVVNVRDESPLHTLSRQAVYLTKDPFWGRFGDR